LLIGGERQAVIIKFPSLCDGVDQSIYAPKFADSLLQSRSPDVALRAETFSLLEIRSDVFSDHMRVPQFRLGRLAPRSRRS
jgi:hypothetical protein